MNAILDNTRQGIGGGVITYYFVETRYDVKKEEDYDTVSVVKSSINMEVFVGDNRGKKYKRTNQEILGVLQSNCEDLGADYFELS